jgi:flap endonuclease-1
MGIKNLTQTIKKYSPDSITHENLYKLSGKKVAVDASLIIYQQLLNKTALFKNKDGKITNHITGLFYKIMNYISLNIELIFIFDGKPPENKAECIKERKEKSQKAKEKSLNATTKEEKDKYEKNSIRLTHEMIQDVKHLLNLLGISYIHPREGEGEAYASELCRIGYVDYVLTEDMDTMAYQCPKVIRNCIDRSLKRKDIVSVFDYQKLIEDINLTNDKFLDFCILSGCDYCTPPPKLGTVTALKLIRDHDNIKEIIENSKYDFSEDYYEKFQMAKNNFNVFVDKINPSDINLVRGNLDQTKLYHYLVTQIGMSEKRVQNALKKFHNNYKNEH